MSNERVIGLRTGKTVFKADNKVFKMFEDGYSKPDILNEALNQARIEETPLNIPKILEVGKIDGKWAIIQEYIHGNTFEYLIKTNPENTKEYIEQMVQLQYEMHNIKPPLLNKLKDTFVRKISECELNATLRYDIIATLEKMPRGSSLCHGDFDPSNILRSEDNRLYMLDFSHATVGNPLADVAKTYTLLLTDYDEKTAQEYLDVYCKKSGVELKSITDWLVIVSAANLSYAKDKEKEILLEIIKE